MHADLLGYQKVGAQWLAQQRTALLADDMGLGKTPTSIAAADEVGAQTILILCPGIARPNWVREVEFWQTRRRSVAPIMNTRIMPSTDVVVCSYALIRELPVLKYLLSRHWDLLICDEAQAIKNPNSTQARCVYGQNCDRHFGLASVASLVWLLSGTIMPNHPGEIWSHAHALMPDVSQGLSYPRWVDKYCVKRRGSNTIIGAKKDTQGGLVSLLRPHVLRRLSKDVQKDMPPLRFSQVVVSPDKLPPKSTEVAETEIVVKGALAKLSNGQSDDAQEALKAVSEVHLASLRKWTGLAKAPAVAEYLRDEMNNGLDKVVVFAVHQEVIRAITEILPDAYSIFGPTSDKERDRLIRGFQGEIPGFNPRALVLNLDVGSTALTLTSACNVAFAETSWVPKDIEQAAKRCHRHGQTRPVLARLFSLQGSVDEQVGATLTRKVKLVTSFNTALVT